MTKKCKIHEQSFIDKKKRVVYIYLVCDCGWESGRFDVLSASAERLLLKELIDHVNCMR